MISPGDGFKWQDRDKFIGKIINCDVKSNTLITQDVMNI
jgi:hypothetical protein